jgi:hypothetical protein
MITYSSGNGEIDPAKFLEYIAKRFPTDLANMVKTRDELALRQGNLNTVKDAAADRQKAADELVAARTEADTLRAAAKAVKETAGKQKKDLDDRETALGVERHEFNVLTTNRTLELDNRDQRLKADAVALAAEEVRLTTVRATLDAERQEFDARVKEFQNKVASLSL